MINHMSKIMSESIEKTAPFKARLLSEHPKNERLCKPLPLGRGGASFF